MDGQLSLAKRRRWAEAQFGMAELGDVRRTRRLVRLGAQMAANSSGSIPQQTERVADMKAAYRLFSQPAVTHEAICRPHFEKTRKLVSRLDMVLLPQDTTEFNLTRHAKTEGLGPVGAKEGGRIASAERVGGRSQDASSVGPDVPASSSSEGTSTGRDAI